VSAQSQFGVVTDSETLRRLAEYKGIWTYAEVESGQLTEVSLELLTGARSIAKKTGEQVASVLVGQDVERFVAELSALGADKVFVIQEPRLQSYASDSYTEAVAQLTREKKPSVFLFGANRNARDLAARLAGRLNTGLAADCIKLEVNERGQLEQIRPDFGGKELSVVLAPRHRPQMTTIRPGSYRKQEPDYTRVSSSEYFVPKLSENHCRIKVLKNVRQPIDPSEDIEKATVLVSGGMGLRSKQNFELLRRLAGLFDNASVAGTRSVCEKGWLPSSVQVGQSGKTVSPKLYFAVGLSGAIQHLVGMQNSEIVVAINSDAEAQIFKVCTYGIVGDLFQVVPLLIDEIKKVRVERKLMRETVTVGTPAGDP
jgi:electron transfer flavoprotein alpha subunit